MKYLILAVQGMAVGAANIMPGISGATLAVIFRVYDRLITAANQLFSRKFAAAFKVLIPFAVGALVGVFAFGSAIGFLIEHVPFPTMTFIAGLMAGTMPFLYNQATKGSKKKASYYVAALLAAVAIIFMALLTPASPTSTDAANAPMIFFFIGGTVAAAVMVIPGVSGSMVLIMLGLYPAVIYIINLVREFILAPSVDLLVPILRVALPMVGGVVLGGILMSKLIAILLKTHFNLMYFLILGLVVGTIFILFTDTSALQSYERLTLPIIITGIVTFIVGVFLAHKLGKQVTPSTIPEAALQLDR